MLFLKRAFRSFGEERCADLADFERLITSAPPRALFAAWRQIWRGERLPDKEALDITLFKRFLADVFLYQYDPQRKDFFIKLVGNNILTVRQGHYKPGQYLDELMGKESGMRGRYLWRQTIERPCALVSLRQREQERLSERIILPLRDKAGNFFVIGATQYHSGFVARMDYEPLTKLTNRALFLELGKIPPTPAPPPIGG